MKKLPLLAAVALLWTPGLMANAQSAAVVGDATGASAAESSAIDLLPSAGPVMGEETTVVTDDVSMGRLALVAEGGSLEVADLFQDAILALRDALAYETSGSVDRDYAEVMIRHHVAMIEAARIIVHDAVDEEIRAMAASTIQRHEEELAALQTWMAENP